jgi:hypothetical protein
VERKRGPVAAGLGAGAVRALRRSAAVGDCSLSFITGARWADRRGPERRIPTKHHRPSRTARQHSEERSGRGDADPRSLRPSFSATPSADEVSIAVLVPRPPHGRQRALNARCRPQGRSARVGHCHRARTNVPQRASDGIAAGQRRFPSPIRVHPGTARTSGVGRRPLMPRRWHRGRARGAGGWVVSGTPHRALNWGWTAPRVAAEAGGASPDLGLVDPKEVEAGP